MKKLLLLAMVLGFLVSGCCAHSRSKSYWVKDGKEVPSEQIRREYQECRGTLYAKDGMLYEEYEKDWQFCTDLSIARYKTGTELGMVSLIASSIVIYSSKDLCQRCMESKGYRKNSPRSENDIHSCMHEKGYEWIEEK